MEQKPALVNKQKVVYHFQYDQCEAGYVGCTSRHLQQRVDEHTGKTAIGDHMRTHGSDVSGLLKNFKILKKWINKWDCLTSREHEGKERDTEGVGCDMS